MKVLFLTSSLGGYIKIAQDEKIVKEIVKCNNSNHFIDRLKTYSQKLTSFVCISSDPDGADITD